MKKFSILTTIMLIAALAFQTQAAPRDTQETSYALIQARAGETIEVGHLVVVRAPGYLAWKATDANTNAVIALGRAETGAVSNGLFYAKPGIFKWASTGTITETSVGQNATAMNSTTVTIASVSTNDIAVGKILRVDTDGIWVKTEL